MMKKLCSMLLALAACLMLTVPAFAAGTPAVAGTGAEAGVGYAVSPWAGYTYVAGPWVANASYVVRPWEGNYTYVAAPNYPGYVYNRIWTNRTEGLENFLRVKTYVPGSTYKDVPAGAWYEEGVRTLYERGLLPEAKNFSPGANMTLSEVISLAVHMHCIYNNWTIPSNMSEIQYALNVGIVSPDQYDNYSDLATRRSFAAILSKTLPASTMRGVNTVLDGVIPDVPMNDPGAPGIYTLYRAGILWSNNSWGNFAPNQHITRDSAAVIAARLLVPSQRVSGSSMTASLPQAYGVSLSQSTLSLYPGESRTLAAYVYPVGAVSQGVYWTSSDYGVASVDSYGTVTAYRTGTAIVTATTPAGFVAACTVRVSSW